MENENLIYGQVYNFQPFNSIRKGIYLGRLDSKPKLYRHVIVSKSYRGNFPIVYRFDKFKLNDKSLESLVFVRSKINPKEEEYLIELLKKKGCW